MTASSSLREFPIIGRLIARMKSLAGRAEEQAELRRMDERQADGIAHDLGLSRFELLRLYANQGSSDLLKRRLMQFGLTEQLLSKQHPDVLQDLRRACGTCTTTSRCAHDFAVRKESARDQYCPNTCTLYALKQEGLGRKNGSCCGL